MLSLKVTPSSNVKQCSCAGGKMNSDIVSQEEAGRNQCQRLFCPPEGSATHSPVSGGHLGKGSRSGCGCREEATFSARFMILSLSHHNFSFPIFEKYTSTNSAVDKLYSILCRCVYCQCGPQDPIGANIPSLIFRMFWHHTNLNDFIWS